LLNSYKIYFEYKNETECWNQCIQGIECLGISFHYHDYGCELFKNGYEIDDGITLDWITYLKVNYRHNTRLINHYKNLSDIKTEQECWLECKKDLHCSAIILENDFKSKVCYLFTSDFTEKSNNKWIYIFKTSKLNQFKNYFFEKRIKTKLTKDMII
jgi:hypothetical protein